MYIQYVYTHLCKNTVLFYIHFLGDDFNLNRKHYIPNTNLNLN